MTTKVDFPTSVSELTSGWLTKALRQSGAINDSKVASFDTKIIGEGAGFLGQLGLVTLTYDAPEPDAPKTLVAKFPAVAQENRQTAMFFRFYEREVNFYRQIANRVDLRVPRCYFSAFEPTGEYVLLLEDMAPAKVGDQLAGCAAHQAELCLREIAKFHATWWNSPELDKLDWMPTIDAEWYIQAVEQGYSQAWGPFAEHFGQMLSPKMLEVGAALPNHMGAMMRRFGAKPWTIVHADYRLDNLFFHEQAGETKLSVIDWQITVRGKGAFDVGYFLCGTLPVDERRKHERDLVQMYHSILLENGVKNFSFDECWELYRVAVLFMIVYPVIGIGTLDLANERGVRLFTEILQRTLSAIEDLKSYELLPE
jgi:hypothetical protein